MISSYTIYGDFRDRPSWTWNRREWAIFKAYCHPTSRYQQLASLVVDMHNSGIPVKDIAQHGLVSKQYIYLILRVEKLRAKIRADPVSRRNLGRPIDMGGPRDVWIEGIIK